MQSYKGLWIEVIDLNDEPEFFPFQDAEGKAMSVMMVVGITTLAAAYIWRQRKPIARMSEAAQTMVNMP